MNAQLNEAGALTVTERATKALLSVTTADQLKALAKKSETILEVTNQDGREQCHGALMTLKNTRILIQKTGKASREDATQFQKAVIAEENRLIALISPEEDRLEEIRDRWDSAKEREKAARIQAELERVSAINMRIGELRGALGVVERYRCTSSQIAEHISDLEGIPIDDCFAEFQQQAADAKLATLTRLRELHTAAVEAEAEAHRILLELEELAGLRAEQRAREEAEAAVKAEQDRITREAQTELNRVAQAQREAESARVSEENARRQAELKAAQEELERQAEQQRQSNEAEQARLREERETFERQQAETRRQQEGAEAQRREEVRIAAIKKPSDAELIRVLAEHYRVPVAKVKQWLSQMRAKDAA